jgi:hypothetical protein
MLMELSDEAYEKLLLDKWYDTKCKDKERTKGLFSCTNLILHVHVCIQHEKVIVSLNPSNKHSFINVNLDKILQVLILW